MAGHILNSHISYSTTAQLSYLIVYWGQHVWFMIGL